ncbi:transketolase [Hydrogenophaga sp.]|jgi:transketolase|uniref:transketolase n=1 Tax=Hydrogenophaga sp. TaxID=1904254 RepID=UPI001DD23BBA|nr:transketolase [Hydrogenophaga sp.]MBI2746334.1 transketolase [Burkholderiales bacterium]MDO9201985.1 transketolase [Hydrogenophaga sp.]MDP3627886.1 transketolase [Hydrogenophaga sp.]MDZ4281535.1 transketolase [Hydrogenophaga sp.]
MAGTSTDRVLRPDSGRYDELANALRALAMDAVQQANSGHPGAPMGMAEMAVALWNGHLRHNPANPKWPDRDRFVLSNGHASMLLYALLHLTGYELPIEELQRFRQLHSKTPGHPEVGLTPGVETTTGPLGQGLTNAVGFALAEKLLGDEFNRPGHVVVDHNTYVFLGDGCLMEGISHEACSLAGVWKLGKLIALYDDNGISIDGAVHAWFADDTSQRFRAYGWNVIGPIDGHDTVAVGQAIAEARRSADRPTLIVCRTTIGRGSPGRAGTAKAHGEALGADEIAATRAAIGWQAGPFEVPDAVRARWSARDLGAKREAEWRLAFEAYRTEHPALAAEYERRIAGELPASFHEAALAAMVELGQATAAVASRKASQQTLAILAPKIPEMLGGSADLTGSNLTDFPGCGAVRAGQSGGRHINYGVREFGMAAIMNGLALHGGFIPYGGTFLTFSDYNRNAIRMAALMKLRVVHVFTHDSIGLGEDGPTHQAVEHAASLRLIPNLDVWRPGDAAETAVAWAFALEQRTRPSALLLSRQNLPPQARTPEQVMQIRRGGYVLSDRPEPQVVLIGTGSEVSLAIEAQRLLDALGIAARVVSLPSSTVFDRQETGWREQVLGRGIPRIGVEAGVTAWWGQYQCAEALGVNSFGESAPGPKVYEHFGLNAKALAELARRQVALEDRFVRSPN